MRAPLVAALAAVAVLSGCAPRYTPGVYTTLVEGKVTSPAAAADCLVDGWGKTSNGALQTTVLQYARENGTRVVVGDGGRQFYVADISKSGDMQVRKSDYNGIYGFQLEQDTARLCLARFAVK